MQADAAAADKGSARVEALLAAGQVTARLKASQAQEQQLVSAFLHHLCEQVRAASSEAMKNAALHSGYRDLIELAKCMARDACGWRLLALPFLSVQHEGVMQRKPPNVISPTLSTLPRAVHTSGCTFASLLLLRMQVCALQVLTPVQKAGIVLDAHPYMVNVLAVCTAMAEARLHTAHMSDVMVR